MAGVRDHTQLEVWQLADAIRREVYRLTASPQFFKHLHLRDQLRRAADSVCPNIAEGFARYFPRDFARFLRIAGGSLSELMDHLSVARERGLLEPKEAEALMSLTRRAKGACTRLIRYLQGAKEPK